MRGWARRWLLDYKKPAVSTKAYYTTYEDPVYKYILPEFGDLPLFAVTSERVGAFYDRISGVLSPSMCSKVSMCLNAIFETAIYNDLCDKNPAKFKAQVEQLTKERDTATQRAQRAEQQAGAYLQRIESAKTALGV